MKRKLPTFKLRLEDYTKALTFRVTLEQHKQLLELAKGYSLTASEVIRDLINQAHEQNPKRKR